MSIGGVLSRLLVPGLLGLCLLMIYQAIAIATADIYYYQVRRDVLGWERAGQAGESQWHRAWDYNRKSARLDPDNPRYLAQAARLWEWRLFIADAPVQEPAPVVDRAIDYRRQALARQPLWPASWSHLAVLKARRMELDAEFEAALERSLMLGAWMPGVHTMLVDIGLLHWPVLADASRSYIVTAFNRRMANGAGLEQWLGSVAADPEFRQLCAHSSVETHAPAATHACLRVQSETL